MRALSKLDEPEVLVTNGMTWTLEYAGAPSDQKPARWKHRDILERLREETLKKCAYCEAFIPDAGFPQVDHIQPKSLHPALVLSWDNLTLVCAVCNVKKGAREGILNPYADNPTDHLLIKGPMIEGRPTSTIGRKTVDVLDLRRTDLLLQRAARIQALEQFMLRWFDARGEDKEILAEVIWRELDDSHEFVATLRTYAATWGFDT